MNRILISALVACGLCFTACADSPTVTEVTDASKDAVESAVAKADNAIQDAFDTEPATGANYGAGVAASAQAMTLPKLVSDLAKSDSLEVVVSGEVVEVCQKKGCWMTLEAPELAEEGVTVRFKDYGFFMPKTLSGSKVLVQGEARRTLTSVDDLRHYAEDAGKSAEEIAAITEPKEELEIIATGVRVL